MSPQQARQSVAAWVASFPKIREGLGSLGWFVVILVSGIAGFNRYYQLPSRMDAMEVRVGARETHDAQQDSAITAQGNGMEYLICDRLTSQGMAYHGLHSQQECAADIIGGKP